MSLKHGNLTKVKNQNYANGNDFLRRSVRRSRLEKNINYVIREKMNIKN